MVKFLNLNQGGINVLDYSLKFTKFSEYAPSLVFHPIDGMNHFVTRFQKTCKRNIIRLCYMKI